MHLIVARVGQEDFDPGLRGYGFQVTIMQRLRPDGKQSFEETTARTP